MRAREFLVEAQNYDEMFNSVYKILDAKDSNNDPWAGLQLEQAHKQQIGEYIKWAKKTLKKNDRIVWFLKWVKISVLDKLHKETKAQGKIELSTMFKKDLDIMLSKMEPIDGAPNPRSISTDLEHYLSYDQIPGIQNYTFGKETPGALFQILGGYEREWREDNKGTLMVSSSKDKPIINFGKQAWWLLDRAECRDEGEAMGHCGNTASSRDGERILSFRTDLGDGKYRPHLTFILTEKGYLGEMKGRANEKPAEKYHPFIIKLLMNDIVKGIKGGGHDPSNNFSMNDLSNEQREEIMDKKPSLGTLKMMYHKLGDVPEVRERVDQVLDGLEDEGVRNYGLNPNGLYVVDHSKDIQQFGETTPGNLNNYIGYFNGNDYYEVDYSGEEYQWEELYDGLEGEHKEHVKKKIQKYKDDVDPDMEYDSLWDLIQHNDLDDFISVAQWAVRSGYEVGGQNQMYKAFKSALDDLPIKYGGALYAEDGSEWKWEGPVEVCLTFEEMIRALSDEPYMEYVAYEDSWFGGGEVEIEEPYYGWDEYDEEAAKERFRDLIYEIE